MKIRLKKLLVFLCITMPLFCMDNNTPVKLVFIDSKLEKDVSLFLDKEARKLNREDYITYLQATHKNMSDSSKHTIKFLGSFRGASFEVLKDENKLIKIESLKDLNEDDVKK